LPGPQKIIIPAIGWQPQAQLGDGSALTFSAGLFLLLGGTLKLVWGWFRLAFSAIIFFIFYLPTMSGKVIISTVSAGFAGQ